MKSFVAKRVNPMILLNLRYLRFKLLKYEENKKMCNTLNVITSNILLYTECLKTKGWHFWIVCQIKYMKHFGEIFICMDG